MPLIQLRRTLALFAFAVLALLNTGCDSPSSVTQFVRNAREASSLLPQVAAISFHACVEQRVYQQIRNTDSTVIADRGAAQHACQSNADARDRLIQQYSVLSAYIDLLSTLATGKNEGYDQSIKDLTTNSAALANVDAERKSALAGLSSMVAELYLRHRSKRAIDKAVERAEPYVKVLCQSFEADIKRFILLTLDNEEAELKSLYGDAVGTGTTRLLLYRQFETDLAAINANREIAHRYGEILHFIAEAHSKLFAARGHLNSRETLQEIFSNVSSIGSNVKDIQTLLHKGS